MTVLRGRNVVAAAMIAAALAACQRGAPANAVSSAAPPVARAPAAPPGSPAAFLIAMYANYGGEGPPPTYAKASAWFEPPLAALLAGEAARLQQGKQGALQYDPVCACEEDDGLHALVAVTKEDADTAKAVVTLTYPGPQPPEGPSKITFDLAKANGAWLIHDIHEDQAPSLVAVLQHAETEAQSAQSSE